MNARRFAVLFGLALATIALAFWLSAQRHLPRDAGIGAQVLTGLEADLDAIDRIRIVAAGDRALVTLARAEGRWRVLEVGYAADAARVKRLLIGLAALEVLEPKTSTPANYPALGVEDVAAAAASGIRVELGGGSRPYVLLVGRPSGGSQSTYVRIPAQAQAVEARPALEIARDPRQWLARTVLDIPVARVQSVTVARADGPAWSVARGSRTAAFAASDGPAGAPAAGARDRRRCGDCAGCRLARERGERVLEHRVHECRPAAAAGPPAGGGAPHLTTLRTFDGLVVTLSGRADGERRWLVVDAQFDRDLAARFPAADAGQTPDAAQVAAEAARLAATARGWRYEIPAWKFDALFPARTASAAAHRGPPSAAARAGSR